MDIRSLSNRVRLDAMGIALSALCAVHCLLTIVLISSLGLAGSWLFAPELHWWGLAAATIIAGTAIGIGAVRHLRPRDAHEPEYRDETARARHLGSWFSGVFALVTLRVTLKIQNRVPMA